MEIRRLLLFLLVSFAFVVFWQGMFPPEPRRPAPQPDKEVSLPEKAEPKVNAAESENVEVTDAGAGAPDKVVPGKPASTEFVVHERRQITLGSADSDDDYAIEVEFTTEGAAITSVRLADRNMQDLKDRGQQIQVLGNNRTDHRTFSSSLDVIDEQLEKQTPGSSLETVDWEVRERQPNSVAFAYVAPDQTVEIRKTYRIQPLSMQSDEESVQSDEEVAAKRITARREDPVAYTIQCELSIHNHSSQTREMQYEILGPCGVVLENEEHTRKYRDIKLEFLEDGSSAAFSASEVQSVWSEQRKLYPQLTDKDLSNIVREGEDKWIEPARYAGVDVQFFAALIAPVDERSPEQQAADQWIERIWPVLLRGSSTSTMADITFRMASAPRTLPPDGTVVHDYSMFVGPKHGALLDPPPFRAEKVLDYGSYFGFIARGMHHVLSFLYGIGLWYWLAIISLTVMVRCCLFPLSRKQAISAARMKELQPKINELKQKHGEDKEKMAKAQMELWRKHNINPLGGCLPLVFQLPVFIGLYTCLNTAVDLRLSSFLWIDNLAAPDALFRMPFTLPILGADFNVLPCINVVLFLVQQKLFMPPPTDEQQEMQHKMMNVMTILFAVMFWHVPAGLCMYFVASSLWSIGERKLLGSDALIKNVKGEDANVAGPGKTAAGRPGKRNTVAGESHTDRPKGFLERLMAAAENAKSQAEQNRRGGTGGNGGKRGKRARNK